jgi:exodeoxyribonuclease VII large subunit
MDSPGTNIPEFSVGELSGAVKRTLEGAFGRVRVRGEITECKAYGPGRFYFSLKDTTPDSKAKLNAVIWAWTASRTGLKPQNGTEVIATGRLTGYGDRSSYQLTVERLEYAGEGAMLARIEKLRVALQAEGLFEAARKRALPVLPRVIGVITSEQGAVIQDIRTTLARRFPRHILLWPVPVQGEGAAERIAAAIRGMSALAEDGPVPRPDVLIVARGGGSLEDLMAFNEEAVVRAAASCTIPLISAVGHETDTTLIDFASDRRAPTPTAAAEMAVPVLAELLADVEEHGVRIRRAVASRLRDGRQRLDYADRGLKDLPTLVQTLRQRLDERGERLRRALPAFLATRWRTLGFIELPDPRARIVGGRERTRAASRQLHTAWPNLLRLLRHRVSCAADAIPHPRERIAAQRARVTLAASKLDAAFARLRARRAAAPALARLSPVPVRALLREKRARLEGLAAQLDALSYKATLARGYALVEGPDGAALTRAADVAPGAALTLHFADGTRKAVAEGASPAPAPPRRTAPRAPVPEQETLL